MYWSNQTLQNKETGELVALHPVTEGSTFNWEAMGNQTRFINQDGDIFFDSLGKYTHVEDWWGEAVSSVKGVESDNPYVEVPLAIYIVSPEERELKRKEVTNELITDIETQLREKGSAVNNLLYKRNIQSILREHFDAKPAWKQADDVPYPMQSCDYIFEFEGKKYVIQNQYREILNTL